MEIFVSIIVIVLTFFGYTPTPESIVEHPQVRATIQMYESPTTTKSLSDADVTVISGGSGPVVPISDAQPPYRPFAPLIIIVPNINQNPMPEEPIAPAFEVEVPVTAVPEKIFIATTLEVENISKHPLYSGCSSSPTASFLIHVKDQDGNDMHEVGIWYTGTAANNPGGMITSLKGGSNFHYTIKDIEEGPVGVTFYVKPTDSTELVKHFDLQVSKAPTAPSERPAWCD